MDSSGDESVEECLENALDHVEDEEAGYWVRVALQRMVIDRTGE